MIVKLSFPFKVTNNQGNKNNHFPLVQILYNTTVYKDNTNTILRVNSTVQM
jgi:hypothetical protein